MQRITLEKAKYDGSVKRERTADLVEVRGDWVIAWYEPGYHVHFKHGELVTTDTDSHLFYLNTALPLTAMIYLERGREVAQYVDAALPASFDGLVGRYVDLDLDIVSERGAAAYVKDIVDFERQRLALGYPPEVVEEAWRGIRIGTELLATGVFPFDGTAEALLAAATRAAGR